MRRRSGLLLTLALLASLPSGVAAGGWATITPDAASVRATEDLPHPFGFTVLQHGETPAGWVDATLHVENVLTGSALEVPVAPGDADGHFSVELVFPEPGYWAWRVELSDLEVATPAAAIAVMESDGTLPPFDATLLVGAIERAKAGVRVEAIARYGALLERLDAATARISELEGRLAELEVLAAASR